MLVNPREQRKRFADPAKATLEEKAQVYDSLTARTGTYEIVRDHVMTDVILAKNPHRDGRRENWGRFKVDDQTLTITNDQTKAFIKYTRVE